MKSKISKFRVGSRVLGMMLVFAMLFSCMGVFAAEPMAEDMPVAVATLTDEYGNVQEVDVVYEVVEIPSLGRSNEPPTYEMTARAITSSSNTETGSEGVVEASLTVTFYKDSTFPTDYKITKVSGVWSPYGESLSNRYVYADGGLVQGKEWHPTSNTFGYSTGFNSYQSWNHTRAESSVTISGGSTLELTVYPG